MPPRPADVANWGRVSGFPYLLAALIAAAAAAVLAHALVTSIRRRRRDLAILKTLGFERRDVRATVAWQATTVAAIGLLVGLPLGVGIGRFAWNLFADGARRRPRAGGAGSGRASWSFRRRSCSPTWSRCCRGGSRPARGPRRS